MSQDKKMCTSFEEFCKREGYDFLEYLNLMSKIQNVDYVFRYVSDKALLSDIFRQYNPNLLYANDFGEFFRNSDIDITASKKIYWNEVSDHWRLYLEINKKREMLWNRFILNPVEVFEIDVLTRSPNNVAENLNLAVGFNESLI